MKKYIHLSKNGIAEVDQVAAKNFRNRQGNYYTNLSMLTRIKVKGKQYARPFLTVESLLIK